MSEVQPRPTHPCVRRMERTDNGYVLDLQIPEDLSYFDGHFPDTPIVVGVCQLKWIFDYIQTYTGKPLQIRAMEDVKFLRPLFPGQSCVLELIYVPQPTSWHYQLYSDTQRFASGCLLVSPA
jgi:3-hydroxymyristoyl/3-hydroxydecanoyl-(acyl carrier protein) dehydratase